MISSKIHMGHLNPSQWTNLGAVLSCLPLEREVLHILNTGSGGYQGITSRHVRLGLEEFIYENEIQIEEILLRYDTIEEIRIYTLAGLARYYKNVQERSIYQLDIDTYMSYVYRLQEETEGIKIYCRNDRKRCYLEYLKDLVEPVMAGGALLLWITREGTHYFDCILEFRNGDMVSITTSDRYEKVSLDYSEVCTRLREEYPMNLRNITMEFHEFKQKMNDIV